MSEEHDHKLSGHRRSIELAAALDTELGPAVKGGGRTPRLHSLRTETSESCEREAHEVEEIVARSIVGVGMCEAQRRCDVDKDERRRWRLTQAALSLMLLKEENRSSSV